MDILEILKHGVSGGLIAIIWFLLHQKSKRKPIDDPTYKRDFWEKLGAMLEAHTNEVNALNEQMKALSAVILAKDENLIPRVFESPITTAMLKRTHENVSLIGEAIGEQTIMITEIHKKVAA